MRVLQGENEIFTRFYLGRQYEQDVQTNIERLYLGGDAYSAPAVLIREGVGGLWNIHYLCRDYLGSITHIVRADGTVNVRQELSYDAWGRLRNPNSQTLFAPGNEPNLLLGRGFTGHEHLPWFGLINCNARLYDPAVGRFLSPDPYVVNPMFSQDYNRYTYCRNNPLVYRDPNGEFFITTTLIIIGIGAAVGATINVIANWDSIDNFGQAMAFAGVGALGGGLAAKFPGASKWIAGGTGAMNNFLRQGFDPNVRGVRGMDWQQIGFAGIMGGATAAVGGKLGNAIGADRWFGNIKSPLLRETLQSASTNVIVGGSFGALDAWAHGEHIGRGALGGMQMGLITGTISGIGSAAQFSIDNRVSMWSGEKLHRHHSDPMFMGGNPNQPLTDIGESRHRQLHRELNDFLFEQQNAAGNHMRPQSNNSGLDIQNNFSPQQRQNAMRQFYDANKWRYPVVRNNFYRNAGLRWWIW